MHGKVWSPLIFLNKLPLGALHVILGRHHLYDFRVEYFAPPGLEPLKGPIYYGHIFLLLVSDA